MGTGIQFPNNEVNVVRSTYVDAIYGNDDTGEVDRLDLPFQTINAAIEAVLVQNEVESNIFIRPGTYDELVKTVNPGLSDRYVNLQFEEGAIHQYTGADPGALYEYTSGLDIHIHIHGKGQFLRAGTDPTRGHAFHNEEAFPRIRHEIYGAISIRSTVNHAIGSRVAIIKNVDLIESTAGQAIRENSTKAISNIGTIRSTSTTTLATSNGTFTLDNVNRVISTTDSIMRNGVFQSNGGIIAKNCHFIAQGNLGMSARGTIRLEQCTVECQWNDAGGHGLSYAHPDVVYSMNLKDVTIKCTNASAYSIFNPTQLVMCKAQNVVASNPLQPSQPSILTMTVTNPEVGDVFRIDATGSTAFIDYTVLGGDGIPQVLAGLKTAWLAQVGSGDEFDAFIGGTAANAFLIDDTSGISLVITSVPTANINQVSAGFTTSVVNAGGVLTPTFGDVENQQITGIVLQLEDILVDPDVTIDLVNY